MRYPQFGAGGKYAILSEATQRGEEAEKEAEDEGDLKAVHQAIKRKGIKTLIEGLPADQKAEAVAGK
jgi:hypothetical protein